MKVEGMAVSGTLPAIWGLFVGYKVAVVLTGSLLLGVLGAALGAVISVFWFGITVVNIRYTDSAIVRGIASVLGATYVATMIYLTAKFFRL